MSWSLWPRWLRDESTDRLEEKINDIRRELTEIRAKIDAIHKIVKQLE